jgi:hypothetical protein
MLIVGVALLAVEFIPFAVYTDLHMSVLYQQGWPLIYLQGVDQAGRDSITHFSAFNAGCDALVIAVLSFLSVHVCVIIARRRRTTLHDIIVVMFVIACVAALWRLESRAGRIAKISGDELFLAFDHRKMAGGSFTPMTSFQLPYNAMLILVVTASAYTLGSAILSMLAFCYDQCINGVKTGGNKGDSQL